MKTARALLVSSLLSGSFAFAGNNAPPPFDLAVGIEFASASGDVGFREEVEIQLLSELRGSACFRSVGMAREEDEADYPEDALRLRITVLEVNEETTYDVSTAQRTDPNAGYGAELAHTARVQARIQVALEHPATGRELRKKRIGASSAHRPLNQYDDAQDYVRREALRDLIRETRAFVCQGGAKRLGKELAR
jgi:hypothetical protein